MDGFYLVCNSSGVMVVYLDLPSRQRLNFSYAFVKGQCNAIFLNEFCATRKPHCFCIINMETSVLFGRAISFGTAIRRSVRERSFK